jgi:uncharacterized protein YbjT (DUF2867 family)
MSNELVLVTGGSGFIGSYCILQLLQAGYRVRTTVRSLKREADVRGMLKQGGSDPGTGSLSPPPTLKKTRDGQKPLLAAPMCCTLPPRFRQIYRNTKTS